MRMSACGKRCVYAPQIHDYCYPRRKVDFEGSSKIAVCGAQGQPPILAPIKSPLFLFCPKTEAYNWNNKEILAHKGTQKLQKYMQKLLFLGVSIDMGFKK